jgi:hypothetical protein
VADLASKAIVPSAVRNEPLIHASCPTVNIRIGPRSTRSFPQHKNRGETREMLVSVVFGPAVLIASLMSVSQIPTPRANLSKDPRSWKKYLGLPRATSYYSIRGLHRWPNRQEAKTLLKLSTLLADKWGSRTPMCGYVNARMSIAIVRATHLCLRGSRVPSSQMSNRRPLWEDKAGSVYSDSRDSIP